MVESPSPYHRPERPCLTPAWAAEACRLGLTWNTLFLPFAVVRERATAALPTRREVAELGLPFLTLAEALGSPLGP
jgi:hypothetical protein